MFKIEPFDHIAGCSLGTWSNRDAALACLEFAKNINDTALSESEKILTDWDLLKYAMELASENDEDIDPTYYSDILSEATCRNHLLPDYCSLSWNDNEFRVRPNVESATEDCTYTGDISDELPDGNPNNSDNFMVVSDHGNCTLYRWQSTSTLNGDWVEVWSVV